MSEKPMHRLDLAGKIEAWYQLWDMPMATWLSKEGNAAFERIMEYLPALIEATIGLLREDQLPKTLSDELVAAGEYLLNPTDLMPEDRLGVVGLLEDAVILCTPLLKISQWDAHVLSGHWHRDDDAQTALSFICQQHDAVIQFAVQQRQT